MSLLSQYNFKGRQEQAVTDPDPAIAVTAGAGSGKTLALVGRYLHLLEQGYPLRSILAVTFTEKAAREMRGRIRKALARTSSDELAAKHTKANHDVLSAQNRYGGFNIDSARIGTIHSLCAEILRTHPAEAGLDPAFGMLEEGLSAALQAEAIDAALAWAVSDPGAAALFGDFKEGDLRKILGTLLSRRLDVSLLPILGEGSGVRGVFKSSLSSYLAASLDSPAWTNALADLVACSAAVSDDKLELARQSVLASWDEVQSERAAGDWDAVLSSLTALRKAISTQGKKDNWADIETPRAAMSELRQVYDENLKFLAEKSRFSLDEKVATHLTGHPATLRAGAGRIPAPQG